MRRLLFPVAWVLAATALVLEARPQEPPQPTFRASADLVDVDVSVLDARRLPVHGLTAADFTVLEDGRARPIVAFSAVDLPPRIRPSAPWMSMVAPDVADNDLQREGRLVAILIDRSVAFEDRPASRAFAEAVIEQLRPGDMAAVAYSTFGIPQNFTADRERLRAAIRQPTAGLPADDGGAPSTCPCGVCSLEAIGDIAEAMAPVRQRRKMLLVVGSNIAIQSSGPCGARLGPARERAFRAVDAGNVTVYAYDPSGLPTLSVSAMDRTASAGSARISRNLTRLGNLRTFPDRTGGTYVYDSIRPADRVAEIFRESESYYILGFEPAHTASDGRFRRIRVRVNRPRVTLQARHGYYAGAQSPAASPRLDAATASQSASALSGLIRAAVGGLWPRSDVLLRVTASPVASADLSRATVAATVHVTQKFDGPPAPMFVAPDAAASVVNVLTGAFDREGRALAVAHQSVRVVPRMSAPDVGEYEVVSRLELKPGRYELRTAVEDTRLGRTGSVYTYVDVPDYRSAPVAMSGIFVSVQPGTVVAPDPPLEGLVPVVPTTRREFVASDEVTAFVRLYQGVSRAFVPGYLTVEILDDRDTSVYRQETRLVADAFGAGRATDLSVRVPVARLAPGPYVLGIEARHGNERARRDLRFTVRQ